MKIRNGFVSNSSSSSFVVKLDHKPNDWMDLHRMFYKGSQENFVLYNDGKNRYTSHDVLKAIFQDAEREREDVEREREDADNLREKILTATSREEARELLNNAYEYNVDRSEFEEFAKELIVELLYPVEKEKEDGKYKLKCEFGDEDGKFSAFIEHEYDWPKGTVVTSMH
jgi:hypothetical protein